MIIVTTIHISKNMDADELGSRIVYYMTTMRKDVYTLIQILHDFDDISEVEKIQQDLSTVFHNNGFAHRIFLNKIDS